MLLNDAPSTSRSRFGSIGVPRENAFPAALRHTTRVARLRGFIIWGVGGIVIVVTVILGYQFLRFLPIDLRFAHIAMKGSRITIQSPKLVGYRPDGRPYELRAKVGIQDMSTPDLFELEELDVHLDSGPDQEVLLKAATGLYDSKKDRADLRGGVRIFDDKSYELLLQSAMMDFKASTLTSDKPGTLNLNGGKISGNSVELVQGERRMTFVGDVHSVLYGDEGEASAKAP
ncbi:MAG: LPS export ABC transporter periplasmic protein LptC [Methylocystis sp.]